MSTSGNLESDVDRARAPHPRAWSLILPPLARRGRVLRFNSRTSELLRSVFEVVDEH
jgi:hypothetical protein